MEQHPAADFQAADRFAFKSTAFERFRRQAAKPCSSGAIERDGFYGRGLNRNHGMSSKGSGDNDQQPIRDKESLSHTLTAGREPAVPSLPQHRSTWLEANQDAPNAHPKRPEGTRADRSGQFIVESNVARASGWF